jgi:peroxiredoxin
MRIYSLRYVLLLFVGLFLWPLAGRGQIAKMTPEQPKWGDTIHITYDPKAEGAAFLPGDDVYAICHIFLENGVAQKWIKMEKTGDVFSFENPVKEGMAYLNIYFITLENWDRKADLSTAVYRKAGVLARGANQQMMTSSSPEEYLDYFKKERDLYPDNLAAFRDKWFIQGAFDKANLLSTVEKDMDDLEKRLSKPTVELLYSLSYGHLLLGQEPEARNIIRMLVERFPQSFYTVYAISSYEYQVFSQGIKGEGPEEVKKMKKKILIENPLSRFARDQISSFVEDEDVPLDVVRSVCEPWMKEEQDNPLPYSVLANAYSEKTGEHQKAIQFLDKAIVLLLQGRLRLHNDISGIRTQWYLPGWHQKRAELNLRAGDLAKALADIKTAQAFQKEARPEPFEIEGTIWQKLCLFERAENAWLEASRLGSKKAESYLKEIYQKRHQRADGFEAYLSRAKEKQKPAGSEDKKPAPDFDVKTLEGESLKLSALKGKVIILNFWYIGCAPCRVEMPGLNTLTEEFKDQDVVFIAFALDNAEALEEFLIEKEFKYRIVPAANKIASLFGVKVFPTHILINKRGEIEFMLTGGSEDRHEQLRPLINNLLH